MTGEREESETLSGFFSKGLGGNYFWLTDFVWTERSDLTKCLDQYQLGSPNWLLDFVISDKLGSNTTLSSRPVPGALSSLLSHS